MAVGMMIIIGKSFNCLLGYIEVYIFYNWFQFFFKRLVDLGSHAKNSSFDLKFPEDQV